MTEDVSPSETCPVIDRCAEQVLVLQGAEYPLNDVVGLRRAGTGPDVPQSRLSVLAPIAKCVAAYASLACAPDPT